MKKTSENWGYGVLGKDVRTSRKSLATDTFFPLVCCLFSCRRFYCDSLSSKSRIYVIQSPETSELQLSPCFAIISFSCFVFCCCCCCFVFFFLFKMCQKNLHSTDENNPCAQKTSKSKVNKDGTTTIIYQSFTDSKDYKRYVTKFRCLFGKLCDSV